MRNTDPNRLIAALARDQVAFDLKTVDLCFLAGLHLRADRAALASFEEDQLVDLFEQVCDVVEPAAENPRKRATHAIQRLRDQRMLIRVDGAGLVRSGEYTLTRLAVAIVEYLLEDEQLTRESLTLLTGMLRTHLAELLAVARRAEGDEAWRSGIIVPLGVTVRDLVGGIARRQRGLDAQQEEIQDQIATLLQTDWFGSIDRCQELLDTTTETLRELNEILLRDTHHFLALLQDMQGLASASEQTDAEDAIQRVIEHVDGIASWGVGRQRAWSEYYQYVHRYLRDVVRLDPDRALSLRLRDQITAWAASPFYLAVAHEPSIRLLRPLEARIDRPPVIRPRTDREQALEHAPPEDPQLELEALVRAALQAGKGELAAITDDVLEYLSTDRHYGAAGRIAAIVARLAAVRTVRERPWRRVRDLELEDWSLRREGSK